MNIDSKVIKASGKAIPSRRSEPAMTVPDRNEGFNFAPAANR
jgi:hypothetical protein